MTIEALLERNNELLADLLAAVTTQATPVEQPEKAEEPDPEPEKAEAPVEKEKPVEQTEEPAVDVPAVRKALTDFSKVHGRPLTQKIMARYIPEGQKLILHNLPKDSYADVLAAVAEAEQKAAA